MSGETVSYNLESYIAFDDWSIYNVTTKPPSLGTYFQTGVESFRYNLTTHSKEIDPKTAKIIYYKYAQPKIAQKPNMNHLTNIYFLDNQKKITRVTAEPNNGNMFNEVSYAAYESQVPQFIKVFEETLWIGVIDFLEQSGQKLKILEFSDLEMKHLAKTYDLSDLVDFLPTDNRFD